MPPFPWKRYWLAIESKPILANGLLAIDPKNESIARPFDFFDQLDCLVLLGDPGLGKSTEIRSIADCINGRTLFRNLGHIATWDYLLREVFDSEEFHEALDDPAGLTLFLDSMDEGHQNIRGLPEMLASELSKIEKGKLRLRVTCRSAEWSNLNIFRQSLERIWEGQYREIRLAPLTESDVRIAAHQMGIDFASFSNAVEARRVGHLASNPKDLIMLLEEFGRNGDLPSSQFDLFEKSARAHFTDLADGRPATASDELSLNARLAIAGRIAATMIMSARSSIWTGSTENSSEFDVPIGELAGYSERMPDETAFPVDHRAVNETIHKGWFSGIGANRIGISHQIDMEFLAARYLSNKFFSDETLIELIGKDFTFPQLDQVSAWIAGRRPKLFDHLVTNSPLVLLRSEAITYDEEARFQLTARLLQMFDAEETSDGWARSHYERLNNPRLAEQLRPYLIDKSRGWLVRRVAIDIVEANNLTEFQDTLADVALDDDESFGTRINAAYAVVRIGDEQTRARLLPLLNDPNDKDHELKGVALTANWPENIDAEAVFENLDPPLQGFYGAYNMFFYKLRETLRVEDLRFALPWLAKQPDSGINYIGLEEISNRIVVLAWSEAKHDESIFTQLVNLAQSRTQNLGEILTEASGLFHETSKEHYDAILADDEMRRRILLRITEQSTLENTHLLGHSRVVGLRSYDLSWLVDVWKGSDSEILKEKLLALISRFIGPWEVIPESIELIDSMRLAYEEFETRFGVLFVAVELDSTTAREEREYYEKYLKPRNRAVERESISPSPLELVFNHLDEFEKGNVGAWWQLTRCMAATPDGWSAISEYESDITTFPVWQLLDDKAKSRLVDAAFLYLENGSPNNDEWVLKNILYRPAIGGYRAFRLLLTFDRGKIASFSPETWGRWAATIYYQLESYSEDSKESRAQRQILIELAYKANPTAFSTIVRAEIEAFAESQDNYPNWSSLETSWDEHLDRVLADFLIPSLPLRVLRLVLDRLFIRKNVEAIKFACSLLPEKISTSEETNLVELVLGLSIAYGHVDCWEHLFDLIQSSQDRGRIIVENSVGRWSRNSAEFLSNHQLADLFIWLATEYPHGEDPVHRGSYSPGPRDEIVQWREAVLGTLVNRGTSEAATEVRRISEKFPELTYIKFRHFESLENLRSRSWKPWEPSDLIRRFAAEPLIQLERRYDVYEQLDNLSVRPAIFRFREHAVLSSVFLVLTLLTVLAMEWNDVERWTWAIPIFLGVVLPRIYECIRLRKFSWLPSYADILADERRKLYLKRGLDPQEAEYLCTEIDRQKALAL